MDNKRMYFLIMISVVSALAVSGCVRSASTPIPEPGASSETQVESIIISAATETALATMGLGPETGGGASPEQEETAEFVATATPTTQPPTATPAPTEAVSVPETYTLKKGEFPFCIARRFDIDVDALLNANGLSRGGQFSEGLTLTIPKGADPFQGSRELRNHPTTYTAKAGDSFYSIACLFGDVYPEQIASANGMSVDDTPTAGDSINIP